VISLLRSQEYRFQNSTAESSSYITQALTFYIQRIFGIDFYDYDYAEVNKVLPISLKVYIKKVACYPQLITKADYEEASSVLSVKDKLHINILVMEAKRFASLLFLSKAISEY